MVRNMENDLHRLTNRLNTYIEIYGIERMQAANRHNQNSDDEVSM